VNSSHYRFPKPFDQHNIILFFDNNLVVSKGEQWKRFRKIAAPAFSNARHLSDEADGVTDICHPTQ